ncbi:MAG TPA: Spy/CpxP family protein refolding chaperone [Thermoanaerobaculia bacterium]|nr:Spy/CpxP family protein refolding chaperone [Thermoanaerobaculia bacterium]
MKKRVFIITGALVLTALLAVPFAFAQHMHRMRGQAFGGAMFFGRLHHVRQALGLTDQQVTDIQAVFTDLRQQNQQLRQSQRATMQQVAQILLNNPNDVASAQALIDQQTTAERTMKINALNAMSKALNILTPDQRAKAASMLQQHINAQQK